MSNLMLEDDWLINRESNNSWDLPLGKANLSIKNKFSAPSPILTTLESFNLIVSVEFPLAS